MSGGYWRAPRSLRLLLEDGELTGTAFGIGIYVALAGADREEGCLATLATLAALFGVAEKTVSRSLDRLREQGVTRDTRRQGRKHFRVYLAERATVAPSDSLKAANKPGRTLDTPPKSDPVSDPVSDPMSDLASDTPRSANGRDPAPEAASTSDSRSDTSRARADRDRDQDRDHYLALPHPAHENAPGAVHDELVEWLDEVERLDLSGWLPHTRTTLATKALDLDDGARWEALERIEELRANGRASEIRESEVAYLCGILDAPDQADQALPTNGLDEPERERGR